MCSVKYWGTDGAELMNIEYIIGANIAPWGTPEF